MKVLVACLEDREFECRCEVGGLNYSQTWPHFWMPCPMGDDWLQRVSWDGQTPPLDFRSIDSVQFALFASRQDAKAFSTWLPEADAASEHGYRTMRG